MTFIEFLLEEVNVTLDPEDPAGSIQRVKNQLKTATRDPARAVRQRQQNLKDQEEQIAADEQDPEVAKAKESIRRDEERVARKRAQLTSLEKRATANAQGSAAI